MGTRYEFGLDSLNGSGSGPLEIRLIDSDQAVDG
jgi:hypothetical protein